MFAATEGFEIPHPDFQFKSRREANQLALTKHPPPPPLLHTIQSTHTPPLYLLSELWPDGRNAMHLYSNPDFFFEQWRISVQQSALRRKSSARILSVSVLLLDCVYVCVCVCVCVCTCIPVTKDNSSSLFTGPACHSTSVIPPVVPLNCCACTFPGHSWSLLEWLC